MFLEQRLHHFSPQPFNLATNTILGTTQRWQIDRLWPIEAILIQVNFTVTAITQTAVSAGNCATPDQYENILNLVSKINLTVNDGIRPQRSVIDTSGVRLLEYNAQVGINQPAENWRLYQYAYQHGAAGIPTGTYQLNYLVPMVDMIIGEPLRSRLYLPVHTHIQDPVLSLTFNTLAGMGLSVGTIDVVQVDVLLVRREITKDSEAMLRRVVGTNPTGYIDWDLIEQPFQVPLGSGQEMRFALAIPGSYVNLLMTQYRGGDPLTKDVIDTNLGDTVAHGLGSESLWRLESAQVVRRQWKWKTLRGLNGYSRCLNNVTTSAAGAAIPAIGNISPDMMPQKAAAAFFPSGAVTIHDFLSDGISGDTGNELGSVLDTNSVAQNNLKMEVIGTPASVATNPSQLLVMGRRFLGDLSSWQKF